jgi:uncharacterized lipoprotein YmbA
MNRFLCIVIGLGLAGCATRSDSTQQQLEVHAILDHHEVSGVGCLLTNDYGRWFVVAPGRVTVARSNKPLEVDCKHESRGSAGESWASRYDTRRLIGNAAISAGLGDYVGRYASAGFSYPSTLTVSMHVPKEGGDAGPPDPGTPIF